MKTIPIFQVDAFTERVFGGNPAAVCVTDEWLSDDQMQRIAQENNLSETAFIVKELDGYRIRWFTPGVEVDLCGHATLASAHVFYQHFGFGEDELVFNSKSGPLRISRQDGFYKMDFPTDPLQKLDEADFLTKSLGTEFKEVYQGKTDYLCILKNEEAVRCCNPDFRALKSLDVRGVIVSAQGDEVDFVSRFFAPGTGVDEDPVTGSAHTTLTPYWSKVLDKKRLVAKQISVRGGDLVCEDHGDRIHIYGKAITYAKGEIFI